MTNKPRLLITIPLLALALALSSCSLGNSDKKNMVPIADTEIDSEQAAPTEIDVADNIIPPDPQAPADEFAIGKATPKDPKGRPFLSQGDEGDDVSALQRRLLELGFVVDDSGIFDDATLAAVLTFQKAQGLVSDGVVGTKTWAAVDSPRKPSTTPAKPTTSTGDGASLPSLKPPTDDPAKVSKVDRAEVDLTAQRVRLYDEKKLVAEYPISSGRNGLTPKGTFKVQSKSAKTVSNSDSSIAMKWMTRFNGGIGFHGIPVKGGTPLATPLGERPVSAGCIRMADDKAKAVFDLLPIGAVVIVR